MNFKMSILDWVNSIGVCKPLEHKVCRQVGILLNIEILKTSKICFTYKLKFWTFLNLTNVFVNIFKNNINGYKQLAC